MEKLGLSTASATSLIQQESWECFPSLSCSTNGVRAEHSTWIALNNKIGFISGNVTASSSTLNFNKPESLRSSNKVFIFRQTSAFHSRLPNAQSISGAPPTAHKLKTEKKTCNNILSHTSVGRGSFPTGIAQGPLPAISDSLAILLRIILSIKPHFGNNGSCGLSLGFVCELCSSLPQQSSLVTGQLAELNVPRKHKWRYQILHDTLQFK